MPKVKPKSGRTAGGFALAKTGKSQVQIAREVGVSKVTANQWISGDKKPGAPMRGKILQLYGIAEELWDQASEAARSRAARAKAVPAPPPPPPPPPADDDAAAAGGAFAMARSLQRQAQASLDELEEAGAGWLPAEKAQVIQRLATSINTLAKLTGQYDLGRRLMTLPLWKLLEREMFEALKPYPEAAQCVAERLESFEREFLRSTG
jgi:transcriptional regulator with XRE-family HTH domain